MKSILWVLFASLFCHSAIAQNKQQPLPKDIPTLKILAEKGNAEAKNRLGWAYRNGHGVKEDHKKAVEWWRKAAVQGHADAQNNLGSMTEYGLGVKQDYKEAAKWISKSAEQNHSYAQNNLGRFYRSGLGVKEDHKKAVEWWRKAAVQGLARAQFNLGSMIQFGLGGTKQDDSEAAGWHYKAAAQGEVRAQASLAGMHFVDAYVWAYIAAESGLAQAKEQKAQLAKIMAPYQITMGEAKAKEMIKKNPMLIVKPQP